MALLLFLIFVTLFILVLFLRKDLVNPTMLFLSSFLLSSFLIFHNRNNWDVSLNYRFFVYVLTAVFSFILGNMIVVFLKGIKKFTKKSTNDLILKKQAVPSKLLLMISVFATILYIILILRGINISSDIKGILRQIYDRNVINNANNGFFENQMLKIVVAIAQISWFQFLLDKYYIKEGYKQSTNYINLLLVLIVCLVSTDRNILIRFIIFTFVLWILFFTSSVVGSIEKINFQIIKKAFVILIFGVVIFYYLGKLKNYTSNLERVIGLYGGSGLYNFNLFLSNEIGHTYELGKASFSNLFSIFSSLGFTTNVLEKVTFSEPIIFLSSTGFVYASNIYSSLRPYVLDYGYFGVIIMPFILGSLFEILFQLVKKSKYSFSWLFYAMMVYPLIYFTIDEQFFNRIHLGTLYEIFWLFLFYYYTKRKIKFIL